MEVEVLDKIPADINSQDKASQSLLPSKTEKVRLDLINKLEERGVALREAGLGRGLLYQTIVDGLKATKNVYSTTGKVVASEPDHATRAKFVAVAVEVLGEKARGEDGVRIGVINIRLPSGEMLR